MGLLHGSDWCSSWQHFFVYWKMYYTIRYNYITIPSYMNAWFRIIQEYQINNDKRIPEQWLAITLLRTTASQVNGNGPLSLPPYQNQGNQDHRPVRKRLYLPWLVGIQLYKQCHPEAMMARFAWTVDYNREMCTHISHIVPGKTIGAKQCVCVLYFCWAAGIWDCIYSAISPPRYH